MASTDRDPLASTRRLLVDGTNLLHTMRRSADAAPPAALIGRVRAVVPGPVAIELVFDGPAEPGLRGERIAAGMLVRYGGARSADAVILSLIDEARRTDGPESTAGLLVVTDDRDLRHGARMRGARTAGSAWLLGRLGTGRLTPTSIGNARPPRVATHPPESGPGSSAGDDEPERRGWRPGRGATTKRGNPRRAPRSGGAGRMRP
jgi:hypothetical protein